MQKFALFFVIGVVASTVSAAALENPGTPNAKPSASMPPTLRGAAPSTANMATAPLAMPSAAMSLLAMSPLAMSPLAKSSFAMSPTVAPNAIHSSTASTVNAERSADTQAGARVSNLSLSPSAQRPTSISASSTASALRNTPNVSMSPATAAGLTAPGISHDTVAAQAFLPTERQAPQSLRSPAMTASVAHTSPVAANALPSKKRDVSRATRPMSMQSMSPPARVRRQ